MDKINVMYEFWAFPIDRAHDADAGFDIRTPKEITIPAGGSAVIDSGVHMEIPRGYFGKLESKSGLNVNHGVVSHGGVIDSGYSGSIKIKLYNHGAEDYTLEKGDKAIQIIIQPCELPTVVSVNSFQESERGSNGFGSTGKK